MLLFIKIIFYTKSITKVSEKVIKSIIMLQIFLTMQSLVIWINLLEENHIHYVKIMMLSMVSILLVPYTQINL